MNHGVPPVAGLLARLRSLWHGLRRRDEIEAEMNEEFRHHLELRTEDLIRRGLPPAEAARRARLEFGHVESHKEAARASRGLRLFDRLHVSWLDVKLGTRMLAKYPGLSLVAVVGMSVAIAIGAGFFGFIEMMLDPTLPLDEGDRVVSIQNSDVRNPGNPDRRSLHDFVLWREEVESVEELSAFTADRRNLVAPDGRVELVRVALMTASGFRVARVAPILGRPLVADDEREDAPPVVVIAHEEWQRRFDGDPGIVGRQVRLGTALHTVVGVMPEEFRFPVSHRFWVPLRLDPADYERGGGPAFFTFGRLADGVTLDGAQAELTTMGLRMAAAFPATHEHLRPRVLPYTYDWVDVDSPGVALALRGAQFAISLLLVLVAANVAILVYARTATRTGEIAVRSALGASRRRVVTQLFVEAFLMSATSAAIGLLIAAVSLEKIQAFQTRAYDDLPFWLDPGLSVELVAYVIGLAVLAGVIVGVLPALKATGRRMQAGLRELSSGGSRMQLGRTWTALIVAQVAIAVAVLPYAIYIAGQSVRRGLAAPAYAPEEFLQARLSMERVEAPPSAEAAEYERAFEARYRDRATELLLRLEAEPGVVGATFASRFPGRGVYHRVEVEPDRRRMGTSYADSVREGRVDDGALVNAVDIELFSVFDVPVLAGRGFETADGREGSNAVIVDRVFAERVLGRDDVLGRRVRLVDGRDPESGEVKRGPWLEIVGVVPDFTDQYGLEPVDPKIYQPMTLGGAPANLTLAVRVRGGSAAAFSGRLREIAADVDPALQLHELRTAADAQREAQWGLRYTALGTVAVTLSVLLLSAAGIYAMMSFTVVRRRREIGIRAALGADPRRLLQSLFARAGAQLAAGAAVGLLVAVAVDRALGGGPLSAYGGLLLPAVAALIVGIGLLATLGPARRGLAVQPTEALREE